MSTKHQISSPKREKKEIKPFFAQQNIQIQTMNGTFLLYVFNPESKTKHYLLLKSFIKLCYSRDKEYADKNN